MQACAGEKYEDPATGMSLADSDDEEEDVQADNMYTIPAGADFLVCNSVTEGEC